MIDFGSIFRILKRGWWIISATSFAGALIAAIIVLEVEPTYAAKAQILMGQSNRADGVLGALIQDLKIDDDAIAGEIAIINSGRLLSKVSERLQLETRPEFNTALRPPEPDPSLLVQLADAAVEALKRVLGVAPPDMGDAEAGGETTDPVLLAARTGRELLGEEADFVGEMKTNLSVRQVGNTNLVDIQFSSTDRFLASAIPNAVVDVYMDDQLDRKFEGLRRVTTGLQTRISGMRDKLEASERAVIDYRTGNLAEGFGGSELLTQQIGDLSRRVNDASAEFAELQSDLAGIDSLIEREGAIAATGLFQSDLLDSLQNEVVSLRQRRDLLLERFGADTAQTVETVAAIDRLEATIAEEARRLRNEQAQRVDLAAARVDVLRAELRELEARAIEQAGREVRLTQLERDYQAQQAVYTTFLDKFTETSESVDLQESDSQVISYADVPTSPIAPRKSMSVALGGIGGVFAGMGIVFMMALTDNALRSAMQLRALTGGTVLVQPRARRFMLRTANPVNHVRRQPLGPLSESIRSLRSQLLLGMPKGVGTIVTFASSESDCGKTTTSILLARSLSQMGVSCILVETDLRRPSLARRMNMTSTPDLIDVLTGKLPLDAAIRKDPDSGADVLTARSGLGDPAGLLLSESMEDLLRDLKQRYRAVILDTVPLTPVSDASPMIRAADQVVFMVRWGMDAGTVETALESLAKLDPQQMISVLSMSPQAPQKKYKYV
ncbi:polysaccharide biosynthesis tyrosine autokinase [Salipiger sp. 1_MG-2023]|uniref:GumC family protein n=1 Tax=Salipiger sp. 1_MG-2023 TaxID=3062665 RepID=UPI0026E2F41F|nr:polysaccharide biosynthesis tyrosine autokinase [Salipiger sp. 1_MG-2023]MDO6587027.1 polysaccharide biosynthesis tyrosine autokinase [Salipiger sp. 1_MG-2023]